MLASIASCQEEPPYSHAEVRALADYLNRRTLGMHEIEQEAAGRSISETRLLDLLDPCYTEISDGVRHACIVTLDLTNVRFHSDLYIGRDGCRVQNEAARGILEKIRRGEKTLNAQPRLDGAFQDHPGGTNCTLSFSWDGKSVKTGIATGKDRYSSLFAAKRRLIDMLSGSSQWTH